MARRAPRRQDIPASSAAPFVGARRRPATRSLVVATDALFQVKGYTLRSQMAGAGSQRLPRVKVLLASFVRIIEHVQEKGKVRTYGRGRPKNKT
jgi:hypothetical protein